MKLALYKSAKGTAVDKIIDIGTGLRGFSHNELVFDKLFKLEEDIKTKDVCFSASFRDNGVRFKRINIYSGNWVVINLPEITLKQEKEIYEEAKKYVGLKYDFYGIFFTYVFWWMKKQNDEQWYCSEIAAMLLGWEKFRISPNELAKFYKAPKQPWSFKIKLRKEY